MRGGVRTGLLMREWAGWFFVELMYGHRDFVN